jgi:hypothetical protein
VAKSDTTEELNKHLLVYVVLSVQNDGGVVILKLVGVNKFVGQIVEREVFDIGVAFRLVCVIVVPLGAGSLLHE